MTTEAQRPEAGQAKRPSGTGQAELRRPERLFDGYALDLDGTIYLGDALLPGAAETVARIRRAGSVYRPVTTRPNLRKGTSCRRPMHGRWA